MTTKDDFRCLNNTQSALLLLGGILMVAGMGCYVFMFHRMEAGVTYLVGAVLFAVMQCLQTYHGTSLTLRRLKGIMTMADLFFVLAGVLMIDTECHFMRPMFSNQEHYITYVYNKWLVLLLVAVVLELYSTHRISAEINKKK
jgi:drug/metabolite transporter (DMT)-like permease